ncbi:LysR family transcriptional regulator [Tsukamurella sp. 8J]|uniref:LysR family transcriptional regulator n=1 Tax=Tsukamurella sp. 8J TaxID=3031962 RepID=UPI0023B97F2F|nr:LysR family transcriptional regulator [Tsukamurella sp. 8J]MDF0531496.1 LysR family transcriptional regulator [Tsukamurella sp. 8J]
MIDTHRLMIFRSVVATGSVNGAAAVLGYTPSAVSQHLAALQRETKLRLFERVGRGIEPTPAGRVLAAEASRVMSQIDDLDATIADLRAGTVDRIVVNSFSSAVGNWMPDVVATLTHEFPHTRVLLRTEEETEAVLDARRPDIALVVRIGRAADVPGYCEHELVTEPYVVVLPADHELAGRSVVDTAELAPYRFVDNDTYHGPCRQAMMDACAAAGFSPRFVVETSEHGAAMEFVARGIGVTVLPRLGATHVPQGAVAVPLQNPTPERTISVYVKDSRALDPVVARALELLRGCVLRPQAGHAKTA